MTVNHVKPEVVGAVNGVLVMSSPVSAVTVRVLYGMANTDLILLSWDGHADLVLPQQGNPDGEVGFSVPPAAVAAVVGKTIEVLYTVIRSDVAEPSDILALSVQAAAEVQPVITGVTGASGSVENEGETIDTVLTINGSAGANVNLDIWDGSMSVGDTLTTNTGSWSLTFSGLTQSYHRISAKTVGGNLISEPWGFTIVAKPVSGFEDFEAASTGRIDHQITLASGLKVGPYAPYHTPPSIGNSGGAQGEHGVRFLYITVDGVKDGSVMCILPSSGVFRKVSFAMWTVSGNARNCTVSWLNQTGAIVDTIKIVTPGLGGGTFILNYTARSGNAITGFEMWTKQYESGRLACDSISWSE